MSTAETMDAEGAAALPKHGIKVLLVDDQPIIGEAVRRLLATEKDIIFRYCSDPTAALHVANEFAPTVILQDLVMPDIDGLMLVRFFRANAATRHIPLIVLSTREEPKVKAEAFALGANDYLVKLPDKLELIARIRYHSKGYISLLERNDAYKALEQMANQLQLHNRFIRKTFGRYLTDDVVKSLLESPEGLKLGGERRKITLVMTDLRGFTSMAGRLAPEQVVTMLNRYLGTMVEVIQTYQGTIDEFIGDAIFVLFGAPIQRDDDAERAVACAMAMQLAMEKVNAQNRADDLPEVEMGIGLHTGEVVVGNIGSDRRAKYGVVGSHVNLTARIESYTVGGQVLISETTRQEIGPLVKVAE
jgi:adenylate cyclase